MTDKPSVVFDEAHLSRGLALLGDPAVGAALEALFASEESETKLDRLRRMLPHLSTLAQSGALRKLAIIVLSTGEELFDAEQDPKRQRELERRAALTPAAEIMDRVADFFGGFGSSGFDMLGFSVLPKDPATTDQPADSLSAAS